MNCHYCEIKILEKNFGSRMGENELFLCAECDKIFNKKREMKKVNETITEGKLPKDRLDNYIKHRNGAIFLLAENTRNESLLFLVDKHNKMHSHSKKSIYQGYVDKEWVNANQHEVSKWDEVYSKNMLVTTQKVLKHVFIAELLIEVDETLDSEGIGDRYFRNLLAKSNKQAMRIANKNFDNIYKNDPVISQNMLRVMEKLAENIAKMPLEDYPFFEKFSEQFFEDPKKFRDLKVEFIKPE